ncbi:MAG: sugar ABC transporter ATP-binding protein, partial [Thermotoga sp.]
VRNLKVLIMDEPTRGIDVGAKFEIREFVKGLAKSGMAIIYITSEAPEALEIGDRIAIMRNGKITKVFENRGIEKSDLLAEVGGTVVE